MNNVLEYLEQSRNRYPHKVAFDDLTNRCTYEELYDNSKRIGSFLSQYTSPCRPVAVYMDKSVEALTAFLGIVSAGCFYTVISIEQPIFRIQQILDVLNPECIICRKGSISAFDELSYNGKLFDYETTVQFGRLDETLIKIRNLSQDIHPLYCNFTSGSTGVPKGVLVSHRSVIDFMEYFPDMFQITEKDRIGNQAPFDFDVSVKDIYSTLKTGASMIILPKKFFSIPARLLDCLCDLQVTTLIWAVSALCMISQLKGFTYKVPSSVNKVLFSGEAMPASQLRIWQDHLPEASFVNLYGPTEITCNCTYYPILRKFESDEIIPIGKAFPNERVFLLNKENKEVITEDEIGEICVSGTALALGYYHAPEQTSQSFVQNPLNPNYRELIYRTGDLAFYNHEGNLCFAGRKDFQIKHMGHRIELEEIERILNSYPEVERACCVFQPVNKRIAAFYSGSIETKEILKRMRTHLPSYMIPNVFRPLAQLPVTPNGKMDRKKLLEMFS